MGRGGVLITANKSGGGKGSSWKIFRKKISGGTLIRESRVQIKQDKESCQKHEKRGECDCECVNTNEV